MPIKFYMHDCDFQLYLTIGCNSDTPSVNFLTDHHYFYH